MFNPQEKEPQLYKMYKRDENDNKDSKVKVNELTSSNEKVTEVAKLKKDVINLKVENYDLNQKMDGKDKEIDDLTRRLNAKDTEVVKLKMDVMKLKAEHYDLNRKMGF